MNKKSYEKLPPDLQKIIDDTTGLPLMEQYDINADRNHDDALELLEENMNHETYRLPDDEAARWLEIVKPAAKGYIDKWEAKGRPARQVFDVMMGEMPIKVSLD